MEKNFLPDILNRPLRQFPNLWSGLFPSSLENFFGDNLLSETSPTFMGSRIYEENDQLHVEVPLPGINLNDIEVNFKNGVLTVKGQAAEEEKDKDRKYYRSSKRDYSFSLVLPAHTDEKQKPQAFYADGILKVSMPLAKKEENGKIAVKAGNGKSEAKIKGNIKVNTSNGEDKKIGNGKSKKK